MPNIQAISRTVHGSKSWLRPKNYYHVQHEPLIPLTLAELPQAILSIPLGFVSDGENYHLVGIANHEPGKNLFVAPSGEWVLPFVPLAYRAYPFVLGKAEDGSRLLCIDADSGLVTDGNEGEAFFDETGQATDAIKEMMGLIVQRDERLQLTAMLSGRLAQYGLIQPWPIAVQTDQGSKALTGLFRIDEEALNKLSGDTLAELLGQGGLKMAFCQLLSMQNLHQLPKLASLHAQAAAQTASNLPQAASLTQNDTISFAGL